MIKVAFIVLTLVGLISIVAGIVFITVIPPEIQHARLFAGSWLKGNPNCNPSAILAIDIIYIVVGMALIVTAFVLYFKYYLAEMD